MKYCKLSEEDKYSVQLYDTTDRLPLEWNKILPASHFLQKERLSLSEKINLPDVSFLYAVISKNSKPVALAYFQILRIGSYHVDTDKLNSLQRYAWKIFTKVTHPKLLVAGHLFRHDIDSFYCIDTSSAFENYIQYETAIRLALRRSCAHAVLVKDMPQALVTYFQHYAPQYLMLRNDISMEMQVEKAWPELKDYEKSLKHKYAQRMRKVRQKWDELEIKELDVDETFRYKDEIFNLYSQVSKRQQIRLGYLSRDYIPELKNKYSDDFHVWLAFEKGIPVAFFSAWTKGDVFDMFYIGFDYSRNDELQLYFNILFFSVEQAIAFRKHKLILGRTALEAKARIGCKPLYLSTFLYIKNPLVRNIMLRMQQNISENEGEWENRHPFK